MPLDPAQRHQIEQDAITAAWEAERLTACDDAIALLREIDGMLACLKTLSDDHFNTDPDAIHWGDVGTMNHYSSLLRQITDSAFHEGEHAA